MKCKISLCYIANEIELIHENILALRDYVNEIVIVDTGLNKISRQVLEFMGAKVFDYNFKTFDFSKARNIMIEKATSDWILTLDADEHISLNDFLRLQALLDNDPTPKAYSLYIYNYYKNGLWSCFPVTRLFPKREDIYYEKSIHESVNYSVRRAGLEIETISIAINHIGYINLREKNERYKNLLKKQTKITPDDAATWWHYGLTIAPSDPEYALVIIDKAIYLSPRNSMPYIFSARINKVMGNYDKSFELLQEAEEHDRYQYWGNSINNLRGMIFLEKKEYFEAEKHFKTAIDFDDRLAHSYCNLGIVYNLKGDYVSSRDCFVKALNINPYLLNVNITSDKNIMNFQQDVSDLFLGINHYFEPE